MNKFLTLALSAAFGSRNSLTAIIGLLISLIGGCVYSFSNRCPKPDCFVGVETQRVSRRACFAFGMLVSLLCAFGVHELTERDHLVSIKVPHSNNQTSEGAQQRNQHSNNLTSEKFEPFKRPVLALSVEKRRDVQSAAASAAQSVPTWEQLKRAAFLYGKTEIP